MHFSVPGIRVNGHFNLISKGAFYLQIKNYCITGILNIVCFCQIQGVETICSVDSKFMNPHAQNVLSTQIFSTVHQHTGYPMKSHRKCVGNGAIPTLSYLSALSRKSCMMKEV